MRNPYEFSISSLLYNHYFQFFFAFVPNRLCASAYAILIVTERCGVSEKSYNFEIPHIYVCSYVTLKWIFLLLIWLFLNTTVVKTDDINTVCQKIWLTFANSIFYFQSTISVITKDIISNFQKAYPEDTFLATTHTLSGTASRFQGHLLVCTQLADKDWLDIYRLSTSSGSVLSSYEIKRRAFPFIFDTKSETDKEKRRDSLRDSLADAFPEHNVNMFVFPTYWSWAVTNSKGFVTFTKHYGSDVLVVLN